MGKSHMNAELNCDVMREAQKEEFASSKYLQSSYYVHDAK